MRKFWFAYLAKALVVFPGGFGTLDEMFEILTLAQTMKLSNNITIVVYGSAYWKSILNFELMADRGAISPKDLDLFQFADTPEAAFDILKAGLTREEPVRPDHTSEWAAAISDQPAPSAQEILGPDIAKTR